MRYYNNQFEFIPHKVNFSEGNRCLPLTNCYRRLISIIKHRIQIYDLWYYCCVYFTMLAFFFLLGNSNAPCRRLIIFCIYSLITMNLLKKSKFSQVKSLSRMRYYNNQFEYTPHKVKFSEGNRCLPLTNRRLINIIKHRIQIYGLWYYCCVYFTMS